MRYVLQHFSNMTVVFDVYGGETTKEAKQRKRYEAKSDQHEILFNLSMNVTSTRENFLSNSSNRVMAVFEDCILILRDI